MKLEASSALALGARGKLRGVAFTLAGRTCVRSEAGALWNEWSVAFEDGREGHLAEAAGAFTLYFERPLVPSFDALVVGDALPANFLVTERGKAKRVARWGEVADAPRSYRYADLSSATGESATIDYGAAGSAPTVFVGRTCTLAALGLTPRREPPHLVRAPGGPPPRGLALWFAVGDEGTLEGERVHVIAIVQRSTRSEGKRYTWEEYALRSAAGLRWLVVSDGHWNLVETIAPGRVTVSERGALYDGVLHAPWSSGKARVEWATGELPWTIAVGDVATTRDYVRAPHMLSCESTTHEITWSRGAYLPGHTLTRAFGKRALPEPIGRAPNQPKRRR